MDNNSKGLQIDLGINVQPLQQGLQLASQAVTEFGSQLNNIKRPAADATQSLVNLSRIAQDAPYGFIGIANNLNPMLESFQRLQKETGSASAALKSMASGLIGPAGLGVALGVVSSLFLAFGDKISDFISKLITGNDALKAEKDALAGIGSEFTSAAEKVDKVSIAFKEYHNNIITGKEALKVYNDELGKNFGIKSDINDAEQTFKDKTAAYVEASLQRALADSASKKAAEELLKQKVEQAQGPQVKLQDYLSVLSPTGILDPSKTASVNAKGRYEKDISDSEKIIEQYRKIALDAKSVSDLYEKGFNFDLKPDKSSKGVDAFSEYMAQQKYELQRELNDLNNLKKKFESLDLRPILNVFDPQAEKEAEKRKQYFDKQLKELSDQSKKSGLGDFLQRDSAERVKQWDNEAKKVKQLNDAYESFAKMLASQVTNGIMNVFDAIQKGESPLQSIADMFANIAKSIAAAIIQGTIFEALLTAFPELKAIFAASGALQTSFGYSGPHAEGGITTGPSMGLIGEAGPEAIMPLSKLSSFLNTSFNAGAMSSNSNMNGGQFVLKGNDLVLALNRSNYSLNLRRGGI